MKKIFYLLITLLFLSTLVPAQVGTRISQLKLMSGPALKTDLIPLVDSGQTKKITVLQLLQADTAYHIGATGATGAQGRSGPIGATGATGPTGSIASPVNNRVEFTSPALLDSPPVIKNLRIGVIPAQGVIGVDDSNQTILMCNPWCSTGNTGTTSYNNYLGTGDTAALSIRTKAIEAIHIDSSQNIGIGTNQPSVKLDVEGTSPVLKIKDGTQANGYILTSDANGNTSWQRDVWNSVPIYDSAATAGDTINLTANSYHIISVYGAYTTSIKINFPAGSDGDIILVDFNFSATTGAITPIGAGISTLALPWNVYPNFRVFKNRGGNWH